MVKLSFREALNQAIKQEMQEDPDVFVMGEEVAEYDGAYKITKGLLDLFGAKRVWDSPISEAGFVGLGVGAAMVGLRPIIEVMTWNFGLQAFDQIINHAAKMLYMSGGQFSVPMVIRGPNGSAHMLGAQHSQSMEPLLCNIPGLKIISVSTPYDAKGLLRSAIRDNNPVIFMESEMLYNMSGEIPEEEYLIPIGVGDIKRLGKDVTIVAWNKMIHLALAVADEAAKQGINIEVIDPRTLVPLDLAMILKSVQKTHRLLIVEESYPFASVSAEISALVQEQAFDALDAPISRVLSENVPMPYAENLEKHVLPSKEKILKAVKKLLYLN